LEHGGTICRAKGVKNKVLATKILYDWVEHGRNRAKRENDNDDKDVAKTCRECGEIDSQFHIITECLTKNLTSIRTETDARIDLYIKGVEEKGESIILHKCLKKMIQESIRTEKLRLGMWEIRDAEKVSSIETVQRANEIELNKIRTELENMNAIYFMGCKKLIREKQKMDWRDRNPNTIGKKRNKKHSKKFGKETRVIIKNRNVNEVLKNSYDINEAEMKKKSDKTGRKRKSYMNDPKQMKEEDRKNKMKCEGNVSNKSQEVGVREGDKIEKETRRVPKKRNDRERSRSNEDHRRINKENVGESVKKMPRMYIGSRDQESEDNRNRKKRRKKFFTSKGEASSKEKKRRRTITEDIRVLFGTEDSH
jgi:hypothetical protein